MDNKRPSGLIVSGTTVALNPARAMTSHLRRRYQTHYLPRFRNPRLVFFLDLSILLCAIFLVILNVTLYLSLPPKPAPLGLTFTTGKIESAAPATLVATLSSRDGRTRDALSLQWQLPENTEILKADPPIASDNTVYLGKLEPEKTVQSRLIVRFYVPNGDTNIGFRVPDLDGYLNGSITRTISSSALKVEPLFPDAPPLHSGKVPYRIQNASDLPLEGITVFNTDPITINTLAPLEDQVVLAVPGVRVSALSHAVPLASYQADPVIAQSDAVLKLEPSAGSKAHLSITTSKAGTVHVYHPAISHPHEKTFAVPAGTTNLVIPLDRSTNSGDAWFAVFSDGSAWTNIESSQITTPFEISAAARYYASTGDQIGIGPLPPQVGQVTKYWVQIKLAPTQSDIVNASLVMHLGPNVATTGREALPSGGSLTSLNGDVTWAVPYLAASASGAEVDFEISLTPSADERGKPAILVQSLKAQGSEVKSGLPLESSFGSIDTSLPGDEKASGKGNVQ